MSHHIKGEKGAKDTSGAMKDGGAKGGASKSSGRNEGWRDEEGREVALVAGDA